MIAVTSFSQTGYERYGKRMLETAAKYWPTKIIAYIECATHIPEFDNVEYRSLFDIPHVATFLQYIQNLPAAHGKTDRGYDYRFDCWKFCRKSFAQIDVCKETDGKVFWLDADLEFTQPVPEAFLNGLLTEDQAIAYLGRRGWYTETGFIGFNTRGDGFAHFLGTYEDCYRRGTIFTLGRWHDCEAFDFARCQTGVTGNNLSSFYKNGHTDIDVLPQSVLAPYMTHHKGPAKNREVPQAIPRIARGAPLFGKKFKEAHLDHREPAPADTIKDAS